MERLVKSFAETIRTWNETSMDAVAKSGADTLKKGHLLDDLVRRYVRSYVCKVSQRMEAFLKNTKIKLFVGKSSASSSKNFERQVHEFLTQSNRHEEKFDYEVLHFFYCRPG